MLIRRALCVIGACGLCASVSAAGSAEAPQIGPGLWEMQAQTSVGLVCSSADCTYCDPKAEAKANAEELIRAQTFWSLPREHRAAIAEALAERGEEPPVLRAPDEIHPALRERAIPLTGEELEEAWGKVAMFVDRDAFEGFSPIHQRMLRNFAELASQDDWIPVMPCFTPGVDHQLIMAFEEVISFGMSNLKATNPMAFEQTQRWGPTALDPTGGGQGNPTILTYSFPPDGTFIASGVGEPAAGNALNAFLDGIYGNRATWRAIYDDIFARWGELSGNTYILEPNDDGVDLFSFPGVDGVRGDLRMGGKPIDGNGGTLAYNFFPQNGDMVIDTADNFYTNTTNNSLRLRNILAHEHGHGMGQLHTCPITQSKLMEPFISLAFDGPQFDDILNAQRHYGDPNEPNDNAANATTLGALSIGNSVTVDTVSLDDDLDVDFYSLTLSGPVTVTATIRPQGGLYQAGPQTSSCSENQPYNPLLFLDPAIAIIDSDGVTVLASADANGAGVNETVSADIGPGTFYVRTSASSPSGDQIIAYELDVDVAFDGLTIFVVDPFPTELTPGAPTSFEVGISPDGESLVGTPQLAYRRAGEPSFTFVNLVNTDGELWRADLPAFLCGEDPEYYITASGNVTGASTLPDPIATSAIVTDGVIVAFEDNGNVNLGYTITGNATDGQWSLGAPQGNGRGDPAVDADGSGSAWLTDIDFGSTNSDVDNGETVLTSPALDLLANSTVSYAYWFNDIPSGPIQGGDSFRVQVSTNGGASYATVRTYTTVSNNWRFDTLVEGVDYSAAAPGQGRLRFIVNDIGTQNVIEGGVDAILVSSSTCTDPVGGPCSPADITATGGCAPGTGEGLIDLSDFSCFLSLWSSSDAQADITLEGICDTTAGGGDGVTLSDFSCYLSLWSSGCP